MHRAPPRRPRRWSPACTATVVRVFVVFALTALVAMPERRREITAIDTANGIVVVRWADASGRVAYQGVHVPSGTPDAVFRAAHQLPELRESGPHVLLDRLREWLAE